MGHALLAVDSESGHALLAPESASCLMWHGEWLTLLMWSSEWAASVWAADYRAAGYGVDTGKSTKSSGASGVRSKLRPCELATRGSWESEGGGWGGGGRDSGGSESRGLGTVGVLKRLAPLLK